MQVHDVMSTNTHSIQAEASIQDAAGLMRSFDVGALPVCRGGNLIGIITDRDIAIRIAAAGLSPVHTTVADAMTGNVATCSEHQEIAGAASLMKSLRVRRLPVVNDAEQLVGMVTLANIAESGDPSLTGELLQKICEPSAEMLAT